MKFKNLLLAVGAFIVLATVSTSCKKDKPFEDGLTGTTWVLFENNVPKPEAFTFKFGNDTQLTGKRNGLDYLPGSSYTFSNNTVVGIFKVTDGNNILTFGFGGVVSVDGKKMTFTFGNAPNNNQGGPYELIKQ